MKRILVLALALILAVGSLAVPSYAAEIDSSVQDLLVALEYHLYLDGEYKKSFNLPSQWVGGATSVEWMWRYPSNTRFSGFTVFIQSDQVPAAVYYDTFVGQEVAGTLIHRSGDVSQYYFPFYNPSSYIAIDCQFSGPYYGDVNIFSAFAYLEDTDSIDSVSWFANAMTRTLDYDEFGEPLDGFLSPVTVGSGTEALPVTVSWDGPSTADNVLDYGEFFATFPFSETYTALESATYLFFTCGEILDYGVRLVDASGGIVASLPCELINSGLTQMVYELSENFERIWCYSLVVDLTGYDLTGLSMQVSLSIDKVTSSSINNYEYGFFCQLNSIICKYPGIDRDIFTDFAFWLNERFTTLFNVVNAGFDSVITFFSTEFWNALADQYLSIKSTVTGGFSSLVTSINTFNSDVAWWFRHLDDNLSSWFSSLVNVVNAGFDSVITFFSTEFWNALVDQYLSIKSTVTGGISSLVTSINTFNSDVAWWFRHLVDNLSGWFSRVISALESSGDTEGFQDQVDDQGDRLDQMDDALNSVTKPVLDRVDTNISGIVSDTDLVNTAHVYTYIIDDNIMAPALTMVTILAMMSFALFGKR